MEDEKKDRIQRRGETKRGGRERRNRKRERGRESKGDCVSFWDDCRMCMRKRYAQCGSEEIQKQ